MDKIQKALLRLPQKDRKKVLAVFRDVLSGNILGYDLKKVRGRKDIYRIRKGSVRTLVYIDREKTEVLGIERRSDNTYKRI